MNLILFNFHDFVLLMTIYQCSLFALFLLTTHRENTLSNILFALFLLANAAIPLDILINFGAAFREWAISVSPNLFYLFGFAYWIEGPLLLWYTRSVVYKNYKLKYRDIFYLLPIFIYGIYKLLSYYLLDSNTKIVELQDYSLMKVATIELIVGFIREVLRMLFGLACLMEIRKARTQIQHNFSSIGEINFSWLNFMVIAFIMLKIWAILVSLVINLNVNFGFNFDYELMGLTENYTVLLLVSAFIFLSLSYSTVFEGVDEKSGRDQQCKVSINPEQIEQLVETMKANKPYLDNTLCLDQLAIQVGIPSRPLSTIINRHFNKNFFEFINQYRIEEAKFLLRAPQHKHKTVLNIVLDAGFNSKATFNTFFKKIVGITPSQYRKQQSVNT